MLRRIVLAPGPHKAEHLPLEYLLDDRQANSHREREQPLLGGARERSEGDGHLLRLIGRHQLRLGENARLRYRCHA